MSKWGMNTLSLYVQRNEEVISADSRSLISKRYCTVTSAMNREFWNITSDRQNSIYVGSYGRGTAIDTSDIDILMSLPESYYNQFNSVYGNGQSRLLQVVRQTILVRYPRSEVRADGQVVKINFSDGMFFEILPAFKNWDGSYRYPDTNMGGNWRSTNPKAEQDAMKNKNISSNGLLFDTCKHLRYVRDNYFRSYHLSGIVIDSFVYQAIGNWRWLSSGESSTSAAGTYEKILLDYYNQHFMWGAMPLSAPGSNQQVSTDNSRDCLQFLNNATKFYNLMMMYRCAIREIQTKLEVLDDEFSVENNRNPISFIKTRIKKPNSIYNKLQKMGHDFTTENIQTYLNDVAGVRIVCAFIDDIYMISDLITQQDDIKVIEVKDYIKNPKPNGYRSYHMIVEIPVFFAKGKTPMRVELQIRTNGMDFWATLEHQLRYKKGIEEMPGYEEISEELLHSARAIIDADNEMQRIKDKIGMFHEI